MSFTQELFKEFSNDVIKSVKKGWESQKTEKGTLLSLFHEANEHKFNIKIRQQHYEN
jgi:hypothetical protein